MAMSETQAVVNVLQDDQFLLSKVKLVQWLKSEIVFIDKQPTLLLQLY